jgi:hypothetical protein
MKFTIALPIVLAAAKNAAAYAEPEAWGYFPSHYGYICSHYDKEIAHKLRISDYDLIILK